MSNKPHISPVLHQPSGKRWGWLCRRRDALTGIVGMGQTAKEAYDDWQVQRRVLAAIRMDPGEAMRIQNYFPGIGEHADLEYFISVDAFMAKPHIKPIMRDGKRWRFWCQRRDIHNGAIVGTGRTEREAYDNWLAATNAQKRYELGLELSISPTDWVHGLE